ncbi:hypothetical protein AB0B94_31745 [Micromonospora sp. NPDC048986]|uniref:hypothetical protein n=2 Tax=unclassified Micromonospora TaxID=2617518 RepID=UPI003410BDD2
MRADERTEGPYSKSTMRVLGAASVALSILVVVWGAVEVATGGESGVRMIVIGGICAVVTAIAIPLAIRRGRL